MEVKIYWKNDDSKILFDKVIIILEELWLEDFIKVKKTTSLKIKKELNITKEPALIVEEKDIDFTDTIFEGIIPNDEELKSMFISIIWWWWMWPGCDTDNCWTCSIC
jgi:hypothetical protein